MPAKNEYMNQKYVSNNYTTKSNQYLANSTYETTLKLVLQYSLIFFYNFLIQEKKL